MINKNKTKQSRVKQLGFTLIELMISLALGTIVIAGLISVYVATVVSSYDTIAMSKLSQQTSALVNIMTSDIRRAGYWGQGALLDENYILRKSSANIFSKNDSTALVVIKSKTDSTVIDKNGPDTGECITYTYDVNEDGIIDVKDIVGFRLFNSAAQMRLEGITTDPDSCTKGDWEDITDSDIISVDSLTFSLSGSVCINVTETDATKQDCYTTTPSAGDVTTETLQINIDITASLISDSDVKIHMSQVVRVRNDRVRIW